MAVQKKSVKILTKEAKTVKPNYRKESGKKWLNNKGDELLFTVGELRRKVRQKSLELATD